MSTFVDTDPTPAHGISTDFVHGLCHPSRLCNLCDRRIDIGAYPEHLAVLHSVVAVGEV